MPKIALVFMEYIFYFFAQDGNEPIHVHVSKHKQQKNATKFWVTIDSVELAKDTGSVEKQDMKAILAFLRSNRQEIVQSWSDMFGTVNYKR